MAKTAKSKSSTATKSSGGGGRGKRSGNSDRGKSASSGNKSSAKPGQYPLLEKFFHDSLKDIYWAEKALMKALPKMQKKTTTEQLQQAFEDHAAVTTEQAKR